MRLTLALPPPDHAAWTEAAVASLVGQAPVFHGEPAVVTAARLRLDGRAEITIDSPGMADVLLSDGYHCYWSTHCRHGRHLACAATELAPGVPRQPARCKTCSAPCTCECHVVVPPPS